MAKVALTMNKPKVYFVNGTAAAKVGEHLFKNVICGVGPDISYLNNVANIIELFPGEDGVYYLQDEGSKSDYGECYLAASEGVAAGGIKGHDGAIGAILSPIRSLNEYCENIQAIKDLLELQLDVRLYHSLLRLLFIGVCGEMEGYLSSTLIALIQGVRDVFLSLRDFDGLPSRVKDEYKWREAIVNSINDGFQFQHIRSRGSRERRIYEKLLGREVIISQELFDYIEWRNKLAHRVPFYTQGKYPTKTDVLLFIDQSNGLVNFIDHHITQYKEYWLDVF